MTGGVEARSRVGLSFRLTRPGGRKARWVSRRRHRRSCPADCIHSASPPRGFGPIAPAVRTVTGSGILKVTVFALEPDHRGWARRLRWALASMSDERFGEGPELQSWSHRRTRTGPQSGRARPPTCVPDCVTFCVCEQTRLARRSVSGNATSCRRRPAVPSSRPQVSRGRPRRCVLSV